jgi:hypothetical protein
VRVPLPLDLALWGLPLPFVGGVGKIDTDAFVPPRLKDAVAGVVVTAFAVAVVVAAFSVALALAVIVTPVPVTADAMEVKVTGLGDWRLASDLDSEGTTIVTVEAGRLGGAGLLVAIAQLVTVVTGTHTVVDDVLGKPKGIGMPCHDLRVSAHRPGWIASPRRTAFWHV